MKTPSESNTAVPPSILFGVVSAAFTPDGSNLLLVSANGWALLALSFLGGETGTVVLVLTGAQAVNKHVGASGPARDAKVRVAFQETSSGPTQAHMEPDGHSLSRHAAQRSTGQDPKSLTVPLGPLCGGLALDDGDFNCSDITSALCAEGGAAETQNTFKGTHRPPKIVLWDDEGAGTIVCSDNQGHWRHCGYIPMLDTPKGLQVIHEMPRFSSGCNSSFVRAVSCCRHRPSSQDVENNKVDAAAGVMFDLDLWVFVLVPCSPAGEQREPSLQLSPASRVKLSDLWTNLDSPAELSSRDRNSDSVKEGGRPCVAQSQTTMDPGRWVSGGVGTQADSAGEQKSVSCQALVGGICGLPYMLVQGLRGGEVVFSSLAAYAVPKPLRFTKSAGLPTPGQSILATTAAHNGPVTCLFEVVYFGPPSSGEEVPEDMVIVGERGVPLLASGGADGSVSFWTLDRGSLGERVFEVHAHTGAVRQVVGATAGAHPPWCECVATVGDDCVIALVSLTTKQVVRVLSGHPFHLPSQLMWDGVRGFMACLGVNPDGHNVLVIWDLYSGLRDRVFVGSQAQKMLECFATKVQDATASQQDTDAVQFREGSCARVAIAAHGAKDQIIKLLPGPRWDISILDIDVTGILESPSGVLPSSWTYSTMGKWRRTVTVELLATALLAMHAWGVDQHVDESLCALLGELNLNSEGPSASSPVPECVSAMQGMSLTQGVVVSDNGAITIQMPPALAFVTRQHDEDGSELDDMGTEGRKTCAAPAAVSGATDLGHLWSNVPQFVGMQLLYAVALAKKLMHEGLNQVVATACSAIVKLYAIQFLDLAPGASVPDLGVLVGMWDTKNDILKETARVLLASTTDLNRLLNSGQEPAAVQLHMTGRSEVERVTSLWESCSRRASWEEALVYAQEVVICGALCCVHSRLVPWPILQSTAPLLATLACEPGHPSALMAASMLTDALTGIEGSKWMEALGDVLALLQSLLDACDEHRPRHKTAVEHGEEPQNRGSIKRSESESQSRMDEDGVAASYPSTPPPTPSSSTPTGPSPRIGTSQQADSDLGRTNDAIPDDYGPSTSQASRQAWPTLPTMPFHKFLKVATKQTVTAPRAARSPASGQTPKATLKLHFRKASLSLFDFDGLAMEPHSPDEAHPCSPVGNRLPSAYKEALESVIVALAALDFPLFLHCMGNRLAVDSMAGPQSVLTSMATISAVLRHRDGPRNAVHHLPLLASVLMKVMQPSYHGLRKSCLQGVGALLEELCDLFPMLATNRASDRLAVGNVSSRPQAPSRPGRGPDAPGSLEAIAVYDLVSGHKKKSLSVGAALQQTARHLRVAPAGPQGTDDDSTGLGIAAVCFRQDGEVCAAYCPDATMLCVWDLRVSWGKKLGARGPAVIEPVKVVQLPSQVDSPQPFLGPQLDLSYRLSWQVGNQVALHHGSRQLGLVELHLGT